MGKKPTGGENSKKAAGNAKKAEAANAKAAAESSQKAATEDAEWSKGAKSSAKKEEADAKRAAAAAKKAEKASLLAEEESAQRSTPKNANAKSAQKKSRGTLDLGQLDDANGPSSSSKSSAALNATGIDNALDALSLTSGGANTEKVDRHPERRFKAAYAAYEARRMPEVEDENPGLRKQQREALIRKEFEKSAENPFNQVSAKFDSTRDELREIREREREKVESRLGGS